MTLLGSLHLALSLDPAAGCSSSRPGISGTRSLAATDDGDRAAGREHAAQGRRPVDDRRGLHRSRWSSSWMKAHS